MRFGVCCAPDRVPHVLGAGFDYVELPALAVATGVVPRGTEATNLFVFTDLKLVGPERGDVAEYGEALISQAADLGIRTMVIGSANARRCPDGYDPAQALREFYEAAAIFHAIALPLGVTIAPETLRREESNVGNDLGEFARDLAEYGVHFTCDTFHTLAQPNAGQADLAFWRSEIPHLPAHVHIAARDRSWRVAEDLGLAAFVERLDELGYDGRVSFEARWDIFEEELPLALDQAMTLFNQY